MLRTVFSSAQVDQLDNIRYMYANVKVKMSEYFFPDYLTIQIETIQIQGFFKISIFMPFYGRL